VEITQTTRPGFMNHPPPPTAPFQCNDLDGTIFAPLATFTDLCPQNNVGNIIVKDFIHGAFDGGPERNSSGQEVHYAPFNAEILCPCELPIADAGVPVFEDVGNGFPGCPVDALVLPQTACSADITFNTIGAVCVPVQLPSITGWNASNMQGRTITVTGATMQGPLTPGEATGAEPGLSAGPDGFIYFNFTGADNAVASASMGCVQ